MRRCVIRVFLCLMIAVLLVLSGCSGRKYSFYTPSSKEERARLFPNPTAPRKESEQKSFSDSEAPSGKTISFQGLQVYGIYYSSYQKDGLETVVHRYVADRVNDLMLTWFSVRKSDEQLLYAEFGSVSGEEAAAEMSEAEVEEKAKKIGSEWMSLDESRTTRVLFNENGERYSWYIFRFARIVNDIETTDYVEVALTGKGALRYIAAPNPGWSEKRAADLKAFSLTKAEEEVRKNCDFPILRIVPSRFGIDAADRLYLEYSVFTSSDEARVVYVYME